MLHSSILVGLWTFSWSWKEKKALISVNGKSIQDSVFLKEQYLVKKGYWKCRWTY